MLSSDQGTSQKVTYVKQKAATMRAVKKIRNYEDEFDLGVFGEEALQIYIKIHELVAKQAKEELFEYVTEYAYPLINFQRENKTIKWEFIKTNELPNVVQARTNHLIEKENMFAQVTVRFNTRQILAIYDRFGHLMYGSDAVVKDVLEYVVFEKNISDYNSKWRLHSKIIPSWAPEKEAIRRTFIRGEEPEAPTMEEEEAFTISSGESKEKIAEK